MQDRFDVVVSGGGIAGLTAAASFGAQGYSVLCVDPAPPIIQESDPNADLRTTALLQPSVALLRDAGIWDRLAPYATPLQVMRIVDAGGPEPVERSRHDFDAADISDAPFGWNLPNWLLRRELVAQLAELPNIRFCPGIATAQLTTRQTEACITLSDGSRVRSALLIAADGRNSTMRAALGIGVSTIRYGQKALAFAVSHDAPHGNVSTEIHRSGGPFTLVPLPDRDGKPCSAVVWMEEGIEAQRLATLPVPEFNAEMTERSAGLLGPLHLITKRSVWPIISQIADRFAGERTALMAETAHVVPPIGAQGLNMSMTDLGALLALGQKHPLGGQAMLDAYHRARITDVTLRVRGIDLLNRAARSQHQPLRDARAVGLRALHGTAPVRKVLMQLGLGTR